MKVLTKINLLLLISVLALVAMSIVVHVLKSKELKYYVLVEDITILQTYTTDALAYEKNYEKTFNDQDLVYKSLDNAKVYLNKVNASLLNENASDLQNVSHMLHLFRNAFTKMVSNVEALLSKKEYINKLVTAYSQKNDEMNARINEQISSGVLTFSDADPTLLQVLKNDSLIAFTAINRIVLFINQDLILEGNVKRFQENYKSAVRNLEVQQKNISIYVSYLDEKLHRDLSEELTKAYQEIVSLVPQLEQLNTENQEISQEIQNHKAEISRITQQITRQAEIIREQQHKNSEILLLAGQGTIIFLMLLCGYFFALSITNPLRKFTKAARAIAEGDYSQELDINRDDEIGQLASDFNKMRENLKESFELIDKQKEQYQSIFENAIEGIFQISNGWKIIRCNKAFAEILGYSSPEETTAILSNINRQLYVKESDHQTFSNLMEQDGFIRGFETRLLRKDGTIITALINAQAINDETGNLHFYQGMIEDISERKRIEEYKIAKEAADESNRAKSEFLAHMSHELRTPLNAILGFCQLMMRDPSITREQQTSLETIDRSGEHLLSLINDVLEFSKIEAGRTVLNKVNFDFHHFLYGLEEMFRLRAEQKGLRLNFECSDDIPQLIRTDKNKLRQVLINLLGNAVKFTKKGQVALSVSKKQEQTNNNECLLHFEVVDTGEGISQSEQENIFEPFFQSDEQNSSTQGTGLGLPISRKFVSLMGGKLDLISEVGKGSRFIIDILVKLPGSADETLTSQTRRAIGIAPGQTDFRILVVEDNKNNRNLLVKLLQAVGFDVKEAVNGKEAVEVWREWQPHLIWMDMRMSIMDGYEATAIIKSEIQKSDLQMDTKIIALTASAFEEDRIKILEKGGDDFVRKPFRESDIFGMIENYLGVKFIYEKEQATHQTEFKQIPIEELKKQLSSLQANLIARLKYATELSDAAIIDQVINDIRIQNSDLATFLNRLAQNFSYDQILLFIQDVG